MKFEHIERLVGQKAIAEIEGAIASVLEARRRSRYRLCAARVPRWHACRDRDNQDVFAAIGAPRSRGRGAAQCTGKEDQGDRAASSARAHAAKPRAARQSNRRDSRSSPRRQSEPAAWCSCAVRVVGQHNEPIKSFRFRTAARARHGNLRLRATASRSHLAAVSAARNAIARKKELTAQKREVFARSQALLANSRSLRTSLEAVQLGRHF